MSSDERAHEGGLVGLSLVLGLVHLVVWALSLRVPSFNMDEHQHTHLAWHFAHGRLVYRDVFDHHGPLFTLWNGALFWLFPGHERFEVVYLLRLQNLPLLMVTVWATVRLAHRLSGDGRVAALAGTLFSGAVVIADKAMEIRPDTPQTMMLALGYMVMCGDGRRRSLWAGVLFGLAGAYNIKALVGPFVLVAVWCAQLLWGQGWRVAVRAGAEVAAGTLGVLGLVVMSFWPAGAVRDLVYYNVVFNLRAASIAVPDQTTRYFFWHALVHQTPLVAWTVAGLVGALSSARGSRLLPLCAALLVLLWTGYNAGMYWQFYVAVMPLVAVVAAVGTMEWMRLLRLQPASLSRGWAVMMVLTQLWLTGELLRWYGLREPDPQARRDTEWVLRHVGRDEPVAWLWNRCAGFQFNPDVQYFWCPQGEHFREASTRVALGGEFRQALEDRRVPVIVGLESDMRELPEETARYIRSTYQRLDSCLLVRKDSPLAHIPIRVTDD